LGRYIVKISDGLLVLFTAMLAVFTFGLWLSTRRCGGDAAGRQDG
jgi:hypothetical protein